MVATPRCFYYSNCCRELTFLAWGFLNNDNKCNESSIWHSLDLYTKKDKDIWNLRIQFYLKYLRMLHIYIRMNICKWYQFLIEYEEGGREGERDKHFWSKEAVFNIF